MSVSEIQALGQAFADAFDQRDIKTVIDMLSDDVEVIDTVPYRFDGKPLFAKFLTEAFEVPFLLPPPKNPCAARAKKASQAGRRRFDPGRPLFVRKRLVAGFAWTLRWLGRDVQRAAVPV